MDLFNRVPTELCVQILISLQSKTTIHSIIRASPRMLNTYLANKASIKWGILASDLDKDMVQDAMFIILLRDPQITYPPKDKSESIKTHLTLWLEKRLPDPIESGDYTSKLFRSLDKLHSVLTRLTEDYVTKATSTCIARSLPCLPQMGSGERYLTFKGKEVITRIDAAILHSSERKRLIKSFLLYEWSVQTRRMSHLPASFRDNTWKRHPPRVISVFDQEALKCVETYVSSIYRAIFAQINECDLPEARKDFDCQTGILNPHIDSASPAIHYVLSHAPALIDERSQDIAAGMATWGLDMLSAFLRFDMSNPYDIEAIDNYIGTTYHRNTSWYINRRKFHMSRVDESISYEAPMYKILPKYNGRYAEGYRWRAWCFFEDQRLYPKGSIHNLIPTWSPFNLTKQVFDIVASCQSRNRKRKQEKKYIKGPSEPDKENGRHRLPRFTHFKHRLTLICLEPFWQKGT